MYIICKHILLRAFLNEPEHIFLHTAKWFQSVLVILFSNMLEVSWLGEWGVLLHCHCSQIYSGLEW